MTTALPDPLELTHQQLHAVQAWHAARRQFQDAVAAQAQTREMRMDVARRAEVLRQQHIAIVTRTDEQLRDSVRVLHRSSVRALLAHRNDWFVGRLSQGLYDQGIEVIARVANGAEAVGVSVAEQPDLVLVEDALPMLTGEQVIREIRQFAPRSLVTAQVTAPGRIGPLLAAGAVAAFSRRLPPAELSQQLADLVAARPSVA